MNDARYRFEEAAVSLQKEKNMYKEIENYPTCFKVRLGSGAVKPVRSHTWPCPVVCSENHRTSAGASAPRRLCGGGEERAGELQYPRVQRERGLRGHGAASAGIRWAGRGAGVSRLHLTAAQIHGQRRESPSMHHSSTVHINSVKWQRQNLLYIR